MFHFDSYIFFDGTCADAMNFYQQTLGGEIEMMMTHGQSPEKDQVPKGSEDRILHASLRIGERRLMASDSMVGQPYEGMKGFCLSVNYTTVADARRVFDQLADGGKVTMPLGETFWAEAFGMLVDRFGTPWMVSGGEAKKFT